VTIAGHTETTERTNRRPDEEDSSRGIRQGTWVGPTFGSAWEETQVLQHNEKATAGKQVRGEGAFFIYIYIYIYIYILVRRELGLFIYILEERDMRRLYIQDTKGNVRPPYIHYSKWDRRPLYIHYSKGRKRPDYIYIIVMAERGLSLSLYIYIL
jgi:hypothetical protein